MNCEYVHSYNVYHCMCNCFSQDIMTIDNYLIYIHAFFSIAGYLIIISKLITYFAQLDHKDLVLKVVKSYFNAIKHRFCICSIIM
jgi:hypothetical protein